MTLTVCAYHDVTLTVCAYCDVTLTVCAYHDVTLTLFAYHDVTLTVGSGSLSSPMREHRNFAQFYCISVTNFSTVSECIRLQII